MVRVGEITWVARVEGADKATAAANDIQEEATRVASQSEKAASAQNDVADASRRQADAQDTATDSTGSMNTSMGLLSSGAVFAAAKMGILTVATKAYTASMVIARGATTAFRLAVAGLGAIKGGILAAGGGILGGIKSFIGWLAAGSAGALAFAGAIGAVLGTLAVFVLDVLGVLDAIKGFGEFIGDALPDVVADGINAVVGAILAPLALLGGFIIGFVRGGFDKGFAKAREVLDSFLGSWTRTLGRIKALFTGAIDAIVAKTKFLGSVLMGIFGGIRSFVVSVPAKIRTAFSKAVDKIWSFVSGLKNDITSAFSTITDKAMEIGTDIAEGLGGSIVSAINAVIPSSISIPSVTLSAPDWAGGMSITIGGQSLELPQLSMPELQQGGTVAETGAAVVHRGEAVLPAEVVSALDSGRSTVSEATAARSGPMSRSESSSTVVENNYDITVGDQSLDISGLSRSDLRRLATEIDRQLGTETNDLTGV